MGKRLIALFAGTVAVGMVIAGCGGGDDSSTATITKAQFVKKAEAACEKGNKQIEKEFASYIKEHKELKNPTEDDYAELVDVVVSPAISQEVDEIKELGAPKGDEDKVDAMIEAREESLQTAEDEPKVLISNSEKAFGKASKLAKEYGLKACATR